MNKILLSLFLFFIFLNHSSSAQQVPLKWIKEDTTIVNKSDDDEEEFGHYLEAISDFQQNSLELIPKNKANSSWAFDEYQSQFSVSTSGIFGLTAIKANSAVELRWRKDLKNKNEEEETEGQTSEVFLSNKESKSEIREKIGPAFNTFIEKAKIKNPHLNTQELEKNLSLVIDNMLNLTGAIGQEEKEKSFDFPWIAKRLRVDLTIGASGKILAFAKVGADLRLRLIWNIIPTQSQNAQVHNKEDLLDLLSKVKEDVSEAEQNAVDDYQEDFDRVEIENVGVGIGLGIGAKWQLFEAETTADFLLFFEKNPNAIKSNIRLRHHDDDGEYLIETDSGDKSFADHFRSKRGLFKKSLKKAFKRSAFVARHLHSQKKKKWNLERIRVDFSLTRSSFFGLSTAKAKTFTEIMLRVKAPQSLITHKNLDNKFLGVQFPLRDIMVQNRILAEFKLPIISIKVTPELEWYFRANP